MTGSGAPALCAVENSQVALLCTLCNLGSPSADSTNRGVCSAVAFTIEKNSHISESEKCTHSVMSDSLPWTLAPQVLLCMGFSRQEYRSGLPFPPPGDLPNPGIESGSSALQTDSLSSEPPGKSSHISGPAQFKPFLFKGQLYMFSDFFNRIYSLLFYFVLIMT